MWNSALSENIFASANKVFISREDLELGNNSIKFWEFSDIFSFAKFLSLNLFGNSWDNLHIPCLLLIIPPHFTCGERKFAQTSKRLKILWTYEHDCM